MGVGGKREINTHDGRKERKGKKDALDKRSEVLQKCPVEHTGRQTYWNDSEEH